MGCNCKNKNVLNGESSSNEGKNALWVSIIEYSVKTLIFLLSLVFIIPIINVYLIYLLFKMVVLNKNVETVDMLNSIIKLGKRLNVDEDEEDDEEEEDYDEDELVLTEYEDISIYDKNLANVK